MGDGVRAPHPGLDDYLGRMCGYDERSPAPLCRREAPNGGVTLIIGLGEPIEIKQMSSSPTPHPGRITSFVAGLAEGFALVESQRQHGIQLDLTPLGAYRLFGLPMSEIANSIVPLDDLRGRAMVAELAERLAGAPGWAERFALIDRQLLRWADEGPEPDGAVSWAWDQLTRSDGRAPWACWPTRSAGAGGTSPAASAAGGPGAQADGPGGAVPVGRRAAAAGRAGHHDHRRGHGLWLRRPQPHDPRVPGARRPHPLGLPQGPLPDASGTAA